MNKIKAAIVPQQRRSTSLFLLASLLMLFAYALVSFGVIRDAGKLDIYVLNAQHEPIPCALLLPEQHRSWPFWKSATTNNAVGISTNSEGYWSSYLAPGTYTLTTPFPVIANEQEIIVYPWWKTTVYVEAAGIHIKPSFTTCTVAT